MKQKDLNKKSDIDLLKLKKNLEMDLIKANSSGSELVKNKEAKIMSKKGMAQKGTRTSLKKQIRRTIAQVNTEIRERVKNEYIYINNYFNRDDFYFNDFWI